MKKIIGCFFTKTLSPNFKYIEKIRNIKVILLLILTLSFSNGCVKQSINLNDEKIDNRIKCLFLPLKDITGSYNVVNPKLEAILEKNCDIDFVEYIPKRELPARDRNKILIQPNYITVSRESSIAEETTINEILESKYNSEYKLLISGTVEQLHYGSVFEVKQRIADIYLWGLWTTLAPAPYDIVPAPSEELEYRAAILEYNIKVHDFNSRKLIYSCTIQGAAKSPVRDREKIVKAANMNVSDGILVKLYELYTEKYNIKPKIYYEKDEKYYRWENRH